MLQHGNIQTMRDRWYFAGLCFIYLMSRPIFRERILCGVMFYISGLCFRERILCDIIRFSYASKSKLSGLCFNDMANLYTIFHMFSYRRCTQDEYTRFIHKIYTRFVYKIYTTNGHLLSNSGGTMIAHGDSTTCNSTEIWVEMDLKIMANLEKNSMAL